MVYQVRKTHNILSLWSGVGGPDHYIERVMKQLRCILQLPDNTPIGFVLHQVFFFFFLFFVFFFLSVCVCMFCVYMFVGWGVVFSEFEK